jgi:hypothetical protein
VSWKFSTLVSDKGGRIGVFGGDYLFLGFVVECCECGVIEEIADFTSLDL